MPTQLALSFDAVPVIIWKSNNAITPLPLSGRNHLTGRQL